MFQSQAYDDLQSQDSVNTWGLLRLVVYTCYNQAGKIRHIGIRVHVSSCLPLSPQDHVLHEGSFQHYFMDLAHPYGHREVLNHCEVCHAASLSGSESILRSFQTHLLLKPPRLLIVQSNHQEEEPGILGGDAGTSVVDKAWKYPSSIVAPLTSMVYHKIGYVERIPRQAHFVATARIPGDVRLFQYDDMEAEVDVSVASTPLGLDRTFGVAAPAAYEAVYCMESPEDVQTNYLLSRASWLHSVLGVEVTLSPAESPFVKVRMSNDAFRPILESETPPNFGLSRGSTRSDFLLVSS